MTLTTSTISNSGENHPTAPSASNAAAVRIAIKAVGFDSSSSVIVNSDGTDTERGTALLSAYEAAKLLTPGGNALSAANRARVVIPPGKYKLSSTLTLDADFVDMVALIPEKGGSRLPTDTDIDALGQQSLGNDLSTFRPPNAYIYSEVAAQTVVQQTATNVRLIGFGIASLATNWIVGDELTGVFAFQQGDIDATASHYERMYFWSRVTSNFFAGACGCYRDFTGTWVDCIGNALSFVIGKGTWAPDYSSNDATDGEFRAQMFDCEAGSFSFIGDGVEGGTSTAVGAKFYRCRSVGCLDASTSGYGSFGSCGVIGTTIDSDCYFEECEAGDHAYGLAKTVSGTFVRCTGGKGSFAGRGVFAGTARNCVGGDGSFGGRFAIAGNDTPGDECYCSGTLIDCISEATQLTRNIAGATLRNCRMTTTANNIDGIKLLDSDSSLTGCDILVVQGGSGIPINADSAKEVSVAICLMNNAANDADGLGFNVTNLVSSAGNIVSDSLR